MPKKGSRKIGERWFTQEELLQAGRELGALFDQAQCVSEKRAPEPKE
ncbi:MAG: hypothetical protein AAF526_10965 [Pseudomonadota bacterium]